MLDDGVGRLGVALMKEHAIDEEDDEFGAELPAGAHARIPWRGSSKSRGGATPAHHQPGHVKCTRPRSTKL